MGTVSLGSAQQGAVNKIAENLQSTGASISPDTLRAMASGVQVGMVHSGSDFVKNILLGLAERVAQAAVDAPDAGTAQTAIAPPDAGSLAERLAEKNAAAAAAKVDAGDSDAARLADLKEGVPKVLASPELKALTDAVQLQLQPESDVKGKDDDKISLLVLAELETSSSKLSLVVTPEAVALVDEAWHFSGYKDSPSKYYPEKMVADGAKDPDTLIALLGSNNAFTVEQLQQLVNDAVGQVLDDPTKVTTQAYDRSRLSL